MKRKRDVLPLMLGVLALSLALFVSPALSAQEIKVGAVMPVTGRFAFAGVHINEGLEDALMMANAEGGIHGKKIKYIMEDGTYKVDVAVAAFKRIMARDKPIIMYGESTALGKAMAPEIKDRYKVLYGSTSFSSELADARKVCGQGETWCQRGLFPQRHGVRKRPHSLRPTGLQEAGAQPGGHGSGQGGGRRRGVPGPGHEA
ncbi:MAG: ABC transporter substrate-binding protein [Deltaproteobacteria bacterium]|nr:ABC transporter substrate-binding protein [Deltaproteobacteria bacterium]